MTSTKRYSIVALLAACAVTAAALIADPFGGADDLGGAKASAAGHPFVPERPIVREPVLAGPRPPGGHAVARITRSVVLYERPGGRPMVRIRPRTQFGSARDLGVVRRRRHWIAVLAPELKNGWVAWIPAASVASLKWVGWSLHADISNRRVIVRRNGKAVRSFVIAVGRASNPTPPGRYAVTDALRVKDPDSPYGCCVLALTGHQTRLPAGWPGGDRLALHATRDLGSVGLPASLGCMRMYPRDIDWLVRRIPPGTPVFVRP